MSLDACCLHGVGDGGRCGAPSVTFWVSPLLPELPPFGRCAEHPPDRFGWFREIPWEEAVLMEVHRP